ncbi:MAG: hypothetical protein M3N28_05140 [Actinomycetota bacterium]|nr:hypothetical protein [Actinomycetota bacterium]
MAVTAQSSAVHRIVRVKALRFELSTTQRVVVSLGSRCLVAQDAHGVTGEDCAAAPLPMRFAVAALS